MVEDGGMAGTAVWLPYTDEAAVVLSSSFSFGGVLLLSSLCALVIVGCHFLTVRRLVKAARSIHEEKQKRLQKRGAEEGAGTATGEVAARGGPHHFRAKDTRKRYTRAPPGSLANTTPAPSTLF